MMRAVFAVQAPTLLNRFARSTSWRLEVARLGDADFAETSLLSVPRWDGNTAGVGVVVVCSPLQLGTARRTFPRAKVVWAQHNGRDTCRDQLKADGFLCMSQRCTECVKAFGLPTAVIRPHYAPEPLWAWDSSPVWTLRSRPKQRAQEASIRMRTVASLAGASDRWEVYGQDQPLGFATPEVRLTLMRSACYLSAMPLWAGFGLSEHECFANGVPVIGSRWGDSHKMDPAYCLDDSLETMAGFLRTCLDDQKQAEAWSAMGLQYIAEEFTMRHMNEDVEHALQTWGAK